MVNVLRRFSKPIMLVITVIVIVSFTVWGPNIMRNGSRVIVGQLGGKDVLAEQMLGEQRKLMVYRGLGLPYAEFFMDHVQTGPYGQSELRMSGVGMARALVFENEADA